MRELYAEIKEELLDFIEDYNDVIRKRTPRKDIKQKPAVLGGQLTLIRPAYLFAERVENAIKVVFGGSVVLSAVTATFVGFASLSQLVTSLIQSVPGRITLFIVGLSYVVIGIWKILHLNFPGRS
jgi:hypothetical protein